SFNGVVCHAGARRRQVVVFSFSFPLVSFLLPCARREDLMNKSATKEKPLAPSLYFEPDILSGHQYFKVFRQKSYSEKEEKLMFAVLTDAIECFQRYADATSRRGRTLFREAE